MIRSPYLDALREARREAATQWRAAVDALVGHVDDEAPDVVTGLVAACDNARDVFLGAHFRVGAEEFQLRLVPVLGRRGDQLPEVAA